MKKKHEQQCIIITNPRHKSHNSYNCETLCAQGIARTASKQPLCGSSGCSNEKRRCSIVGGSPTCWDSFMLCLSLLGKLERASDPARPSKQTNKDLFGLKCLVEEPIFFFYFFEGKNQYVWSCIGCICIHNICESGVWPSREQSTDLGGVVGSQCRAVSESKATRTLPACDSDRESYYLLAHRYVICAGNLLPSRSVAPTMH